MSALRFRTPSAKTARRRRRLNLESLEDRRPLATLAELGGWIRDELRSVRTGLDTVVSSTAEVPVLGKGLHELARPAQFALQALQDGLATALAGVDALQSQELVDQALTTVLRDAGVLKDLNHNGFDDDVTVRQQGAAWSIHVNLGVVRQGPSATIGLGLPGLPLAFDRGNLSTSVEVVLRDLAFGIDANGSFVLDTSPLDQLEVGVHAELNAGTTVTGTLGFMTFGTQPNRPPTASLDLRLRSDLTGQAGAVGLATPRLDGGASVLVPLETQFTGNVGATTDFKLPGIRADFALDWQFHLADPLAPRANFGDEPTVEFRNVQFGLGTFLSNVLEPVFATAKQIAEPLRPILDILEARIPGLSDLSEAAGADGFGSISIASLAQFVAGTGTLPPEYQLMLEVLTTFTGVEQAILAANKGHDGYFVPVGNFSLAGSNIRSRSLNDLHISRNLTDLIPVAFNTAESVVRDVRSQAPAYMQPVFTLIDQKLRTAQNGFSYSFPLLQSPTTGVFRLMLGQDVDFVQFTGRLHLDAYESRFYPLWGPLAARFNGQIDADFYVQAGYDTYGLRQFLQTGQAAKLADGFYLDATRPLLKLDGSLSAGVAGADLLGPTPILLPNPLLIGPPLVPLLVTPVFSVNAKLAANDVEVKFNSDSDRFRLFEANPQPLFLTQGTVTAGADVVVEAGIPGVKMVELYEHQLIPEQVLLDLDNGPLANPVNTVTAPPAVPPPVQIVIDVSRTRYVNEQNVPTSNANDHRPDTIELYTTRKGELRAKVNGVLLRTGFPVPLSQVASIRVYGSDDDDTLVIDGELNKPVDFVSGPGHNSLQLDDTTIQGVVATYDIAADHVTRKVVAAARTLQEQVTHGPGVAVTLRTAEFTSHNTITIGALTGRDISLNLGGANHTILADLTLGGEADQLHIARALGARRNNINVLRVFDNTQYIPFGDLNGPATYTLSDGDLVRTKHITEFLRYGNARNVVATATIHYSGLSRVEVDGTDMGNTFLVESSQSKVDYVLSGGVSDDLFRLGSDRVGVGRLSKTIKVSGGGGQDTLIVDDAASAAQPYPLASRYTLDSGRIVMTNTYTLPEIGDVSYAGRIDYDPTLENLVVRPGGALSLVVRDTPSGTTRIEGAPSTPVKDALVESAKIVATSGPLTLGLTGGDGNVTIGSPQYGLNLIRGTVDIVGRSIGMSIDDSPTTIAHQYYVGANVVQRSDLPAFTFAASEHLTNLSVRAGRQRDTLTVLDTPATSAGAEGQTAQTFIDTNGGNDLVLVERTTGPLLVRADGTGGVRVGDGQQGLDAIQGRVRVSAAGSSAGLTLTLDDRGTTVESTLSITAEADPLLGLTSTLYSREGAAPVQFTVGMPGRFSWLGGDGGNQVDVAARPGVTSGFQLGGGTDEVWLGANDTGLAGLGAVDLISGAGAGHVLLDDSSNRANSTYTLGVTLGRQSMVSGGTTVVFYRGPHGESFAGATLLAGSGDDVVRVNGAEAGRWELRTGDGDDSLRMPANLGVLQAPLAVDLGAGQDTLDYSATSNAVRVNLQAGAASGLESVAGVERVEGGAGDDVLVGSQGAQLSGGGGRDLLIAGPQGGELSGGAGEDLLIGGTTPYDLNDAALAELASIWSGGGSYAARAALVQSGRGGARLGPGDVRGNGESHRLLGAASLDLFFGSRALDDSDWNPAIGELFIDSPTSSVVHIDLTSLSAPYVVLDGVAYPNSTRLDLPLSIGPHSLHTNGQDVVEFTVAADGTVLYDASLEGVLRGAGGAALEVRGAAVTLDARHLSVPALSVDGLFSLTTSMPGELRLLPGAHTLLSSGYDPVPFAVNADSFIEYAPELEGILLGAGGPALEVLGVPWTLDSRQLSAPTLYIDGLLTVPSWEPSSLRLLPGLHYVTSNGYDAVGFSLGMDGTVGYDSAMQGVLDGAGGGVLVVLGREIAIDATGLTSASWLTLDGLVSLDTSQTTHVRLLPGTHSLQLSDQLGALPFLVTSDGAVDYSVEFDARLRGRGGATLIVLPAA